MSFLLPTILLFLSLYCHAQTLTDSPDSTFNTKWTPTSMHSSVDPASWVKGSSTDSTATIKQPTLPKTDNDSVKEATAINRKIYQTGKGTYYSMHGRMMASGKRYDKSKLFCAHRTLPFGTKIRVVNKRNGREVVVEVLDRGPFGKGMVVDLSYKAAAELDMLRAGVVPVEIYIESEP